jgi:hypothetical protein
VTVATSPGAPPERSATTYRERCMKDRRPGRNGIEVSSYCLGTMMFGAGANSDHHESIRIIYEALDAGINKRLREQRIGSPVSWLA